MSISYVPVVDEAYKKAVAGLRKDMREFIKEKNCAPLMLRLAWHDAASYCKKTRTGGPNGSIRLEAELNYKPNAGLRTAVGWCEEWRKKFPLVSFADIVQLGGVLAVELTGGPAIDFMPGRKDSSISTPEDRLPDPHKDAAHLRQLCDRLGLRDKEIVVLSGGHTIGRAHKERTGFEGPWTREPFKFDNGYFKELLGAEKEGLLRMPTDKALVMDAGLRKYVEAYAKDNSLFLRDYAAAHKKFSELGCRETSPSFALAVTAAEAAAKHSGSRRGSGGSGAAAGSLSNQLSLSLLGQSAVGIAATVLVCILGYLYEMRRRAA
ncbi:hypothetical protein CBR_g29363 [Chara braunii]|uniref:L-ascorbate peroxidase n=1 Tax=Chara braunii TaxID=69332 RepID=A0A388JWI1_CHABU|nr:hypothetical protein CBR_g29363 [Chara braunii]|eukprot:GBG62164.1 hypothetical protein CBR_g29363 [Chara braunii]